MIFYLQNLEKGKKMTIELKVKCFNPGCDITLKVDNVDVALSTALSLLSNEVIKLMDNRELKPINFSIPEQPQTLTIKTSDGSSTEEIQF